MVPSHGGNASNTVQFEGFTCREIFQGDTPGELVANYELQCSDQENIDKSARETLKRGTPCTNCTKALL